MGTPVYGQTVTATGNTITIPAGGIPAGTRLILDIAFRYDDTTSPYPNGTVTVTDTRSNVWYDLQGLGGAILNGATAVVVTALQSGDTIVVTSSDGSDVVIVLSLTTWDVLEQSAASFAYDRFVYYDIAPAGNENLLAPATRTVLLHAQSRRYYDAAIDPTPAFVPPSGWTTRLDAVYSTTLTGFTDCKLHVATCTKVVTDGSNTAYDPTYNAARTLGWYEFGVTLYSQKNIRHSAARLPSGLKRVAQVLDDGTLGVIWYSDVGSYIGRFSVVSSLVTDCSLICTRDGVLRLFYAQDGNFRLVTSRDSGSTWSSVTTIAIGYQGCTVAHDPTSGIIVAMLYASALKTWYVSVSSISDIGSWSTPASVVATAEAGGTLVRRQDGVWEFSHVTEADAAAILRCRNVTSTSGGTWS